MILFTIGFTQKSAKTFFELIKENQIELLIDVRLNNKSQLAGFSKGTDLDYFLKEICNCKYVHCQEYAPTKEILDDYKKKKISWKEYVEQFIPLMEKRDFPQTFIKRFAGYERICLLCSEPTPEQCHRRLLAEMVKSENDAIIIKHI